MSKLIDLTGKRFGNLIVLERAENKGKQVYWKCKCDCGNIKNIRGSHLKDGSIISCGCIGKSKLKQAADITNEKFGRLIARRIVGKKKGTKTNLWECECECGNLTTATVSQLRSGEKRSCGCINKEQISQLGKNNAKDLTGQKFGLLTALYPTEKRINRCVVWHCKCDCGNEHDVSSVLLRNGSVVSCGCFHESLGEQKINLLLKNNNIEFEQQKKFSSCYNKKTNRLLFFDFYVNNKYLIEYDGEQHFEIGTGYYDNPEKFEKIQERDTIKNQWCKDNNIPLIRIPYWHLKDLKLEDLLLETSEYIVNG